MPKDVNLQVVPASGAGAALLAEIQRFCDAAYGEDLSALFAAYVPDVHVLALSGGRLVGYAMIVSRWLQAGNGPMLRTAYIEMVATAADRRNQGIGAQVMRATAAAANQAGYHLAALCPADTTLYSHLGWEYWQGPLFIRPAEAGAGKEPALIPTPEERVMVLRLDATPPLDLTLPLSAEWRAGGELW